MPRGKDEIVELSAKFRGEQLLIESERANLQQLNTDVESQRARLFQQAWVCRRQNRFLGRLVFADCGSRLENACQEAKAIEGIVAREGHKLLGSHECWVADLLRKLMNSPQLVAQLLCQSQNFEGSVLQDLAHITYNSIYGACLFPFDEKLMLSVLLELVKLEFIADSNPRRLLRKGSSAFGRLYRLFSEGHYASRMFLTAALHEPIMTVLSGDELFLDIDPKKSAFRFPPAERIRRFGEEGTKEYQTNIDKYRGIVVGKLQLIMGKFISSLRDSMQWFPPCLVWLIRQLYDQLLSKAATSNSNETEAAKEEAYKICTDLILTYFICPAVANPEPLGIIGDVPVSYIARFNLMQIGQILQTLAVLKYEQFDPSLNDLYSNLDQDSVSSLVSGILGIQLVSLEDMYPSVVAPELPSLDLSSLLIRNVSLITLMEVNELLSYLRSVEGVMLRRVPQEFEEVKFLLNKLPSSFTPPTLHLSTYTSPQMKNISPSGYSSSVGKKRSLSGKIPSGRKSDVPTDGPINNPYDAVSERNTDLLIIPIGPQSELVGFQSEEKVLQSLEQDMTNLNVPHEGFHGKRTRFSLSRDQESTGTSENLEAEGSSNHSVCSSAEEDIGAADGEISLMNDNLSDVMPTSANVSTPSVSGRDTPLSSHPEEIAGEEGVEERPPPSPLSAAAQRDETRSNGLPVAAEKESRADIQEKFGKFEIPPPTRERHRNFLGDETHSLVSDSWSTDVLASDSEYGCREDAGASALPDVVPGQPPDIPRLDLIAEESNVVGATGGGSDAGGDDRSDTWSVDVLASDTEDAGTAGSAVDVEDVSVDLNRTEASSYAASLPGLDIMDFPEPPYSFHHDPDDMELNSTAATRGSVTPPYSLVTPGDRTPPENRLEVSFSGAQSSVGSDKLRRQSSGSSFQSKSDVDSEWLREDVTLGTEAAAQRVEVIPPISVDESTLPSSSTIKPLTVQLKDLSGSQSPTHMKPHADDAEKTPVAVFSSMDAEPEGSPLARQSLGRLSFGLLGGETLLASKSKATGESAEITGFDSPDAGASQQLIVVRTTSGHSKSVGGTPDNVADKMRAGGAIPKVFAGSSGPFINGHGKRISGTPKLRTHEDMKTAGKNFLKGLKGLALTGKGKVTRSRTDDQISSFNSQNSEARSDFKIPYSASNDEIVDRSPDSSNFQKDETSDEILEKYRQPPHSSARFIVGSDSVNSSNVAVVKVANDHRVGSPPTIGVDMVNPVVGSREETGRPYVDNSELSHSQTFLDAKRKLRLVLSSVDVQTLPNMTVFDAATFPGSQSGQRSSKSLELLNLLKILLAEAINGQDKTKTAQIRETMRCISAFDQKSLRKLMRALRDDHKKRVAYLNYLSQSKLNLLRAKSFFDRLLHRVEREQQLCDDCLVEVCARIYLEKRERDLQRFLADFQRLELQDEKTDLVDVFLQTLFDDMQRGDETWRSASEVQITRAQLCIERSVMSQIYIAALYPNGDGDVARDQVLHDHIKRLSEIITPTHQYCNIPAVYHAESPWPSAQSELAMINAYKTPRDKLFCVARTCEIIMNLLKLSSGNSGAPAADDFTPVLIFVLIKANPPSLLSTIEYVDAFYGKRISGEYSYWWMQFCAAVKFIKTCDYST